MNQKLIQKVKSTTRKEFEGSGVEYHNFEHTVEFVEAAKKICEGENVSEREKEDVIIAGWLHDVGAIEGYEGHEKRSAEKADTILKNLRVSEDRIDKVKNLIMHTDPSLEPKDILQKIMQDADAAFAGKEGFFEKLNNIFKEFKNEGKFKGSKNDFYKNSISLYENFEYRTQTAKEMFRSKFEENLEKLKTKIRS